MIRYLAFILGGIIVAGFILFFTGFFPIAKINGGLLWHWEFSAYQGAFNRFRANIESQNQPSPSLGFQNIKDADLTMSLLEELIVRKIIFRIGDKSFTHFNKNAEDIIGEALGGKEAQSLSEAAKTLYGLSFAEFKELILLPEAREIALRRSIESSGQNYEEWFLQQLKTADVKIYFYDYQWEDGRLVGD